MMEWNAWNISTPRSLNSCCVFAEDCWPCQNFSATFSSSRIMRRFNDAQFSVLISSENSLLYSESRKRRVLFWFIRTCKTSPSLSRFTLIYYMVFALYPPEVFALYPPESVLHNRARECSLLCGAIINNHRLHLEKGLFPLYVVLEQYQESALSIGADLPSNPTNPLVSGDGQQNSSIPNVMSHLSFNLSSASTSRSYSSATTSSE